MGLKASLQHQYRAHGSLVGQNVGKEKQSVMSHCSWPCATHCTATDRQGESGALSTLHDSLTGSAGKGTGKLLIVTGVAVKVTLMLLLRATEYLDQLYRKVQGRCYQLPFVAFPSVRRSLRHDHCKDQLPFQHQHQGRHRRHLCCPSFHDVPLRRLKSQA